MEQGDVIWESAETNSKVSVTLGRVMSNLLSARPKKLEDTISRLGSTLKRSSIVSLEESLQTLHKYVRNAAQREESLDEVLIPMTEHSLKQKGSMHGNQAMILINWLFQDEILFLALAKNIAGIPKRKEDRYITLGWCILLRGLLEYEMTMIQFTCHGIQEKYWSLLKILSPSIEHLVSIVCNRSIVQGEFELPTRLSVAAADCILAFTVALTKNDLGFDAPNDKPKQYSPNLSSPAISLVPATSGEKKVRPAVKSPEISDMGLKLLLWDHLDELLILVQRLFAWSRKSRYMHANGLERVLKWLQGVKGHYAHNQNEAGSKMPKTGVLLLSSCWKHYGILIHLENKFSHHYKELLDQYLSGIQFYADNCTQEHTGSKDSGTETIKFFLNCLTLLLGCVDDKQFGNAISEDGLRISRVLTLLLHHGDEDVIDGAVCILRAVIFRTNSSLAGCSLADTTEMGAMLPLLLQLLDKRDGAARAVVIFIAEYCSISMDNRCLQEVLRCLDSGDVNRRRNAVDVISELFNISPDPFSYLQDIARCLLKCLGDEDSEARAQVSKLIPKMDPPLVLTALVDLVYSSDQVSHSSASSTLVELLKNHNKNLDVLCLLLNCLSNLCQNPDVSETSGYRGKGGSKLDVDKVLKLIPQWSETVDWKLLIEPLVDKMFGEPSNVIIVRFLSHISEHLADAADLVFHQILIHTKPQDQWESQNCAVDNPVELEHTLFDRLCPLLIIRLLPLRVFNDLNSSLMYGEHCKKDSGYFEAIDTECVAGLLLNRALNKSEFEEVRKLAAELCGRIHPQVLFPIIASQMEDAVTAHDILKIKACLFSICTSLVVRGRDSILHPVLWKIKSNIKTVLLWPSLDGDEVSKAQHGCIDCLALMICTELQDPESFGRLTSKKTSLEGMCSRDAVMKKSILRYVTNQLTCGRNDPDCSAKLANEDSIYEKSASLSFRLCMANVLISACQKIPDSSKKPFAQGIFPELMQYVKVMTESEIRSACVQERNSKGKTGGC